MVWRREPEAKMGGLRVCLLKTRRTEEELEKGDDGRGSRKCLAKDWQGHLHVVPE